MRLFIKTHEEDLLTLDCTPEMTVLQLKEDIWKIYYEEYDHDDDNHVIDENTIILWHMNLRKNDTDDTNDDEKTLGEIGLENDSVVHVNIRVTDAAGIFLNLYEKYKKEDTKDGDIIILPYLDNGKRTILQLKKKDKTILYCIDHEDHLKKTMMELVSHENPTESEVCFYSKIKHAIVIKTRCEIVDEFIKYGINFCQSKKYKKEFEI